MFWEKDSREMRYKRLQHLLEKSNVYSKFLLMKMEQQQLQVRILVLFYQPSGHIATGEEHEVKCSIISGLP